MADLRQTMYEAVSQRAHYGKYRGRVLDNADPLNLGRVQVEIPAIAGGEPLGWALPCLPYAGDGYGFYIVPEIDALVWVEFEGGDLSRPIWVGCFWASEQLPDGAEPGVVILHTKRGNRLQLSDNNESVQFKTAGEHEVVLSDSDDTITLKHSGGASITLEGNTITVDGGGATIVLDGGAVNINNGSLEVT